MGKSKKGSNANDGDDNKHKQAFQAVLLADSFLTTFRPISLDQSKMTCPLNNVKILDYAMDFLAGSGVEELFVVCTNSETEKHVQQHAWSTGGTMNVVVIQDSTLLNAGDALREVDKRNVIQSDPFILMFGDVITNADLSNVFVKHLERHKKDSSAIMTLVLKQVGGGGGYFDNDTISSSSRNIQQQTGYHDSDKEEKINCDPSSTAAASSSPSIPAVAYSKIRSTKEDLVIGMDPTQENRVVLFNDKATSKDVSLPCSFFTVHSQIDLHTDIMDSGIYICSPDVLARFSDNFDYRDIQTEFIAYSAAEEEEGLQNRIYAHLVQPHEYIARVSDFRTYHAISKDLLRRWCYPIVPDNLPSGYDKDYRYVLQQRHYLYREHKMGHTKIGRTSKISGPGMIGSHVVIGEDCTIQSCVIGNHCQIASNVTLIDCHIWDGTIIQSGARVHQSILAQNVTIRQGVTIGKGSVIGQGCIIGENVVIPEFSRITQTKDEDHEDSGNDDDMFSDDDDEEEEEKDNVKDSTQAATADTTGEVTSDPKLVGPGGVGHLWEPNTGADDDDDDSDEDEEDPMDIIKRQSIGFDAASYYSQRRLLQAESKNDGLSDNEDEDDDDDLHAEFTTGFNDDGGFTFGASAAGESIIGDVVDNVVVGRQKGVDVVKELKDICLEFEESGPVENLGIELNSYKFSQNATYSDCTMATMLAILEKMEITESMTDGKLVGSLKTKLEYWSPLLQKMSIGQDEEKAIIYALEKVATGGGEVGAKLSTGPSLRFLLQTLHDEEVVSEEAILGWAATRKEEDKDSDLGKIFNLKPIQDFLEWLEEESEDDDEEDDEEDDDGDDEED